MDSEKSVAVVVTTYNHAAFLDDAIRSILSQSIPADEIIVVDDGSTDDPDKVVARYPSLRLIRQRNQGLSAARNTGLRAATSAKIVFLDADDRLCQTAIEAGLACFGEHPDAGFVYGGFHYISADGQVTSDPICRDIGPEPHLALLRGNQIGMHATVLYDRRRLLDSTPIATSMPTGPRLFPSRRPSSYTGFPSHSDADADAPINSVNQSSGLAAKTKSPPASSEAGPVVPE